MTSPRLYSAFEAIFSVQYTVFFSPTQDSCILSCTTHEQKPDSEENNRPLVGGSSSIYAHIEEGKESYSAEEEYRNDFPSIPLAVAALLSLVQISRLFPGLFIHCVHS